MHLARIVVAALFGACALASAQELVVTGHVKRVVLQPRGAEDCPEPCPPPAPGSRHVCVSNAGGCQTMDVEVDHVYRGAAVDGIRRFRTAIGEWGPTFGVTTARIVVVQNDAENVSWSPLTERDGKLFFDPKRIRWIGNSRTAPPDSEGLVALDDALARADADVEPRPAR